MTELAADDPLPAEGGAECKGFRDSNGNPTVGFCLWCDKDFYSVEEVWEHNENDMRACPEFQRFLDAERGCTRANTLEGK